MKTLRLTAAESAAITAITVTQRDGKWGWEIQVAQ